jgi:hypothetical protein
MASEYAPRGLVGLLTPQANTTAEPEFSILLPLGFAAVNARLVEHARVDGRAPAGLLRGPGGGRRAVRRCAAVAALAFACTGASYLAGRAREEAAVQAIGQRRGVPVVTAGPGRGAGPARAWRAAHRPAPALPAGAGAGQRGVLGVARAPGGLALASPRPPEGGGHPIYGLKSADAGPVLDDLQGAHADAIVMLGTGMPSLAALLRRRGETGVPVLSCMLCACERGARHRAGRCRPARVAGGRALGGGARPRHGAQPASSTMSAPAPP